MAFDAPLPQPETSPEGAPGRARAGGPDGSGRAAAPGLEGAIAEVGRSLLAALRDVLSELPEAQAPLSRSLGVDKVLASRLRKALRSGDPLAVAHHLPGPEPLRRVLRAARKQGVPAARLLPAEAAVDRFESLIRDEIGDRGTLSAMISAWLPEAREEFELRRKQSAFRAMSELKGVLARTNVATAIYHPSDDGEHLDVVWLFGLLGLQRLRPDAAVKFATRRMVSADGQPRHPTTLDGRAVESLAGLRLDEFCDAPPAPMEVVRAGESVHYVLGGRDFGPRSDTDLILAEVNRAELPRTVPPGSGRRSYTFAEISVPVRTLVFDVLLHERVYPGLEPELRLYDTVLDGVADPNDRARDIDRLDLLERAVPLGRGLAGLRATGVPHYVEMVRHAVSALGWDGALFRCFRCRIDFPVYGSQVVQVFGGAGGGPP